MATEIERKFLVTGEIPSGDSSDIHQAYLSLDPERTTRVRIDDRTASLTVKGRTEGISRKEFEFEIPLEDAQELLGLSVGYPIRKTRTRVPHGDLKWEIDVFHDLNAGLVVAEIKLGSEDDDLELPEWVGEEVSHDPRFLNACLAQHPFTEWPKNPNKRMQSDL